MQMVVVSLTGYLISQEEQSIFIGQLRNLAFYVHRSYLLLIQCVMERFPQDPESLASNVWAHALTKLIGTKCGAKKLAPRAERIKVLKQNTEMICNLLKAVVNRVTVEKTKKDNSQTRLMVMSHRIFNGVQEIVRQIEKITFVEAKEVMGKSLRDDYSFIEQS